MKKLFEMIAKIFNNSFQSIKSESQCVERILNKTAKAINENLTGLKLMLQGFRIYFV